jgi:hypothetical protein
LFGGPVAGPVIYYLFEILFAGQYQGQFAGQVPGQLSIIFLKSCSRASSRPSYLISFRLLGASSRSGQLLKASRVFAWLFAQLLKSQHMRKKDFCALNYLLKSQMGAQKQPAGAQKALRKNI